MVVLVGPSGCGKSTTLRMVAGLEEPTAGHDQDRRPRRHEPAARRARHRDGVPELRALPAHDRVREHGVRAAHQAPAGSRDQAARRRGRRRASASTPYLERRPKALSGGQRQRVAIGRAVVRAPKVFLFDEPLSNLDAKLRGDMRREIARIHQQSKTTSMYVTHDQIEAMTLADMIVVLKDGVVQQIGTPVEIYERPANRFVAGFFGTPTMNFLTADLARPASATRRAARASRFRSRARAGAAPREGRGRRIVVGIRPERLSLERARRRCRAVGRGRDARGARRRGRAAPRVGRRPADRAHRCGLRAAPRRHRAGVARSEARSTCSTARPSSGCEPRALALRSRSRCAAWRRLRRARADGVVLWHAYNGAERDALEATAARWNTDASRSAARARRGAVRRVRRQADVARSPAATAPTCSSTRRIGSATGPTPA